MKNKSVRSPRIVQSDINNWLQPAAIAVALVVVIGLAAYIFPGSSEPCENAEIIDSAEQIEALEEKIAALEKERDEYRLKSAQFERASQIDQEVVSTVQTDLKGLQEERAKLRQQVEFLKSLVSGDITGLQLTDLNVEKSGNENVYKYAFTLSKRAKGKEKAQGSLAISMLGKQGDKSKKLSMKELSVTPGKLIMNFQNFQKYKGTLKLPKGFKPTRLEINVKPKGNTFKSFKKDFGWQLIVGK